MKKNYYSLLLAPLLIYSMVANAQSETTADYAYGAKIVISDEQSAFSRLYLNEKIHSQSTSINLDDVRVFNSKGQIVPFALTYTENESRPTNQQLKMEMYSLQSQGNPADTGKNNNNYNIAINGENIQFSIDKSTLENNQPYNQTYLLRLPNGESISDNNLSLKLNLPEQEQWQILASLSYSSNLKSWRQIGQNISLMNLISNNNQSLTINDIPIADYQYYNANYWLLTLKSSSPLPKLHGVDLISSSVNNEYQTSEISVYHVTLSDNKTAVYHLSSPQRVESLSIYLHKKNEVLPVNISYKASKNDKEWQKLSTTVLRNIANGSATIIPMHSVVAEEIQITTINSSFDTYPEVIPLRKAVSLIFNSANNGPFILAWGSANAKPAAMQTEMLLTKNDKIDTIPMVWVGDDVTLGGEKALHPQQTESSQFPRWIIWLALVAGVAFLILLALKLIKEVKKV